MKDLQEKKCVPCEGGTKPFDNNEILKYAKQLPVGWRVLENKKLRKEFPFENFKKGMAFVNKVADLAEEENHHPDICIQYSGVDIEFQTHAIGGLSENDFIMAAKVDAL